MELPELRPAFSNFWMCFKKLPYFSSCIEGVRRRSHKSCQNHPVFVKITRPPVTMIFNYNPINFSTLMVWSILHYYNRIVISQGARHKRNIIYVSPLRNLQVDRTSHNLLILDDSALEWYKRVQVSANLNQWDRAHQTAHTLWQVTTHHSQRSKKLWPFRHKSVRHASPIRMPSCIHPYSINLNFLADCLNKCSQKANIIDTFSASTSITSNQTYAYTTVPSLWVVEKALGLSLIRWCAIRDNDNETLPLR